MSRLFLGEKTREIRYWGFAVTWRWVHGFWFEGSPQFTGYVPGYGTLDAQISLRPGKTPDITYKVGRTNLLGWRFFQAYGAPFIGRLVYAGVWVDVQVRGSFWHSWEKADNPLFPCGIILWVCPLAGQAKSLPLRGVGLLRVRVEGGLIIRPYCVSPLARPALRAALRIPHQNPAPQKRTAPDPDIPPLPPLP